MAAAQSTLNTLIVTVVAPAHATYVNVPKAVLLISGRGAQREARIDWSLAAPTFGMARRRVAGNYRDMSHPQGHVTSTGTCHIHAYQWVRQGGLHSAGSSLLRNWARRKSG
jgi:hypothetical protein